MGNVIPMRRRIRWACANKDCPRRNLPVFAMRKPDCASCRKPLKAA